MLWRILWRLQRQPRSRMAELAALQARFASQPSRWRVADQLRRQAEDLARIRGELSHAYGRPQACASCAIGHPLPHGRWDGGHCCGSSTANLFTPNEVAALKLGGVRFHDLTLPRGEHAGCVFRGPVGCSLEPRLRPNVCVRHVCNELRVELRQLPNWPIVRELRRELHSSFEDFVTALTGEPAASSVSCGSMHPQLVVHLGSAATSQEPLSIQSCASKSIASLAVGFNPATLSASQPLCSNASEPGGLPATCVTGGGTLPRR